MNGYEVLGPIGQGQYGTAYKALNKLDGQLYCIKRIPMGNKDDQKGALREAQLLSTLDHPNIIGYKESFIDKDESLCIITTFCEEGDLFNKIRKKAAAKQFFSEGEVMDMFIQIASALTYIHSKKILHRDLKTQNIFIARGGIIKLGDFGISKVLEKTDQFATTVTGTPYYMAPEICTNQPYTFKSDIWSLGCVLYELCTLKHAFAADSLLSLVYQIVRGNFPPIPTDMFSPGLSNLVNSLLVRDTSARPSLVQIFQMPYVHENITRYRNEEKKRVIRTANTMSRRRQLLEKTVQEVAAEAEGAAEAANEPGLTPKEAMARRKEAERRKREMELKLASLNNNAEKERQAVEQRKKNMIHASSVGLPGSQVTRKNLAAVNPWDVDAADTSPSHGRADTTMNMDDSMVNFGTMASGIGGQTYGTGTSPFDRTKPSAATAQRMAAMRAGAEDGTNGRPTSSSKYQQLEDRPIRPASTTPRAGTPANDDQDANEDDDLVLMGTANGMIGLGHTATAARNSHGGSSSGGRSHYGGHAGGETMGANNTMVNFGTMNLGTTHANGHNVTNGSISFGGTKKLAPVRTSTASKHPSPSSTASGQASGQSTPTGSPVVPSNIVGGFKFGLTNPGSMPTLPSFPSRPQSVQSPKTPLAHDGVRSAAGSPSTSTASPPLDRSKVRFGITSDSQPRGSFDYVIKDKNSRAGPSEDDEGGDQVDSEYEDDFEDFSPVDDQEMVNQRIKILNNVEELEKSTSFDHLPGDQTIGQVQEKVATNTKNSKAQVLRDKCRGSLGIHFNDVYTFLRKVRTSTSNPQDEREVQKRLLELVGNDKSKMQGCFLVDQLVFQEMMYR